MPAKKKKAGKGDKKDKKGKDGLAPPQKSLEELEKPISDSTKEYYLVQIKDVEEKLERYRTKCDELQVKYDDLSKFHSQAIKDREDVIALLKKDLENENDRIQDLEERVIGVKQAKEAEKDKYEVQLTTARSDFQEMRDMLTAENMALKGRLTSLEDYRLHKEEMEESLKAKEEQINAQDKDYSEKLSELEKKNLLDRDRLRKEMKLKVGEVASEFRQVSDQQIADTTRRTIQENVTINQQLGKMSSKTMQLLEENDALMKKVKQLQREVELLEVSEKEFAKKNRSQQKMIGMLLATAKEKDTELEHLRHCGALCTELLERKEESDTVCIQYQQQTKSAVETSKHLEEELRRLKAAHSILLKEVDHLRGIISQASTVIHSSLEAPDSDAVHIARRQDLTAALLALLNLANKQPEGSEASGQNTVKTRGPAFQYSPGDLGFVPKTSHSLHQSSPMKFKKLPVLKPLTPT